ncbi:MAG: hypothetical protein SP4CHLAM5_02700 [Chlamydiia bacterium]|nr:hypothetical protein [Chlamydiia bacterium]MCH9618144.1 hypothetical protein [Chlamydiia bacterium]MCH9624024.1 hypothetical protein [Chlamydiia bacterium]
MNFHFSTTQPPAENTLLGAIATPWIVRTSATRSLKIKRIAVLVIAYLGAIAAKIHIKGKIGWAAFMLPFALSIRINHINYLKKMRWIEVREQEYSSFIEESSNAMIALNKRFIAAQKSMNKIDYRVVSTCRTSFWIQLIRVKEMVKGYENPFTYFDRMSFEEKVNEIHVRCRKLRLLYLFATERV